MHFFFPANARHSWSLIALLLALLLLIYLSLSQIQPKLKQNSVDAATEFSLPAAQSQLQKITQQKHPIGSTGHGQVRDYLLAELKALGLAPQIQTSFASSDKGHASGQVQNIVVRLAGRNSQQNQDKKALLLMAHYDAVPNSFGAADDGVSVVSMLQSLRALKAQAPLANDVIFLFSDGEEVGLLGASAFVQSHPWMKDVGMLLNFDNRGNAGPIMMFEPSAGNRHLITGLAKAVPEVISNSLMYEVYKALPNDTDFTVFRKQGVAGLNFAMIQNISSYHTRYDRSDLINPASQQQQGQMMLRLVRHFGEQDLGTLNSSKGAEDSVYFSFPLFGLIHYPAALALPLALFLTGLAITTFWLTTRTMKLHLLAIIAGAFSFIVAIGTIGFLSQQAWNLVFQIYPAYLEMHDQDTGHFYLLGILIITALAFGLIQKILTRWIRVKELAFGAVLVWVIILLLVSARFPGASFLFAWPLMFVLLSYCYLALKKVPDTCSAYAWILLAGAGFSILLFSPLILLFNIALGFHSLGVPVILFTLLLGLLTPLLVWILQEIRAHIVLLIGLAAISLGAFATANFHEAHPIPTQLSYVAMPQKNQYVWLAPQANLNRQALSMFGASTEQKTMPELFGKEHPRGTWKYWTATAPDAGIAAPVVSIQSDQLIDNQREMVIHIASPDSASNTRIQIEGVSVLFASIQEQILSKTAKEKWMTSVHAMPKAGVTLRIRLAKDRVGKNGKIRVTDTFYSLPTQLSHVVIPTPVDFAAQTITLIDIPE